MVVDNFPHGFFYLVSARYKKVIETRGAEMKKAEVIIYARKEGDLGLNQRWLHQDGFLINAKSGLVMDVNTGEIERDREIIQYPQKQGPANNQRWKYEDGYIFPASMPHLVLGLKDEAFTTYTPIVLKEKIPLEMSASKSQQWIIEPFRSDLSDAQLALLCPPKPDISDEYPGPNDIYDCYRRVCLEDAKSPSPQDISGAAAFMALKRVILHRNSNPETSTDDTTHNEARKYLTFYVPEEATKLLEMHQLTEDKNVLVEKSTQAALQYYDREYGYTLAPAS